MPRLVVKLGGSFITRKDRGDSFPTGAADIEKEARRFVRRENLRRIARGIREIREGHDVILLHGAGPFGHALVQRIVDGERIDPLVVHGSMLTLNSIVLEALASEEVICQRSSPFDLARYGTDYETAGLVSAMIADLEGGVAPVSHGDILPTVGTEGRLGAFEVISADVIARDIALGWPADKVIMVTDYDGILDIDPSLGEGRRIPRISYSRCVALLRDRRGPGADVTGGILEKVVSCRDPISRGVPLQIISGAEPGNLVGASENAEVGTTVETG